MSGSSSRRTAAQATIGRWLIRLLLGCCSIVLALDPCAALSPRTGDFALTGALGASRAVNASDFDSDAGATLSFDFYWSARNSLRGTVGFVDLPGEGAEGATSVSGFYLTGNVSHNWFGRRLFPYVTGGVGVYALDRDAGPGSSRRHLEAGANGGLGVETRFSDTLTLRFEGVLHAMTGGPPSVVAVGTVGLKFYY